MNTELINHARELLLKLHSVTAEVLNMEEYLIPADTMNKLESLIKLNDEEKLKKYILLTEAYINNLKN